MSYVVWRTYVIIIFHLFIYFVIYLYIFYLFLWPIAPVGYLLHVE